MRTHRFEFKKTKKVKVVTHTQAISIDLTKPEAQLLMEILDDVPTSTSVDGEDPEGEAMHELYEKLVEFVNDPS